MGCVKTRPVESRITTINFKRAKNQKQLATVPTRQTEFSVKQPTDHDVSNNESGQNPFDKQESKQSHQPQEVPQQNRIIKNVESDGGPKLSLITRQSQQVDEMFEDSDDEGNWVQEGEDLMEEDFEEGLEGAIKEESNFSTILIYNSRISMEFNLPKIKAGPLVVPLINYSSYSL